MNSIVAVICLFTDRCAIYDISSQYVGILLSLVVRPSQSHKFTLCFSLEIGVAWFTSYVLVARATVV